MNATLVRSSRETRPLVDKSLSDARFKFGAVSRDLDFSVVVPGISQVSRLLKRKRLRAQPFDLERFTPAAGILSLSDSLFWKTCRLRSVVVSGITPSGIFFLHGLQHRGLLDAQCIPHRFRRCVSIEHDIGPGRNTCSSKGEILGPERKATTRFAPLCKTKSLWNGRGGEVQGLRRSKSCRRRLPFMLRAFFRGGRLGADLIPFRARNRQGRLLDEAMF